MFVVHQYRLIRHRDVQLLFWTRLVPFSAYYVHVAVCRASSLPPHSCACAGVMRAITSTSSGWPSFCRVCRLAAWRLVGCKRSRAPFQPASAASWHRLAQVTHTPGGGCSPSHPCALYLELPFVPANRRAPPNDASLICIGSCNSSRPAWFWCGCGRGFSVSGLQQT